MSPDQPRVGDTITTAEQLDALPKGAVLARVHSDGSGPTVYVNEPRMGWLMATEQICPPSVSDRDTVGNRLGHLTVLYVPGEPSRQPVTDNARAETDPEATERIASQIAAMTAMTGRDALELVEAVQALQDAETTTDEVDAVAHHLWSHYQGSLCGLDGCRYQDGESDADYECECPECWTNAVAMARGLADAGLLATARTRPTREQVIDTLREHGGWHHPGEYYYEAQADAVLALWADQPTEAEAGARALEHAITEVRDVYDMQCNPLRRETFADDDYGRGAWTAHRWWERVLGGALDRLAERAARLRAGEHP